MRAWSVAFTVTLPVLLAAVGKKDAKPILAIKTPEDVQVFKIDEAQSIIERLGERAVLYALERVALHDLPRLQVTKKIVDPDGTDRFVRKDFSKLSWSAAVRPSRVDALGGHRPSAHHRPT